MSKPSATPLDENSPRPRHRLMRTGDEHYGDFADDFDCNAFGYSLRRTSTLPYATPRG